MFMPQMNRIDSVAHSLTDSIDSLKQNAYEVNMKKKVPLTGVARAWSKEEEVYLLQTRLQKIPYRHIAAFLKKTELACRLHYHHLSHNNRRKKARSASPSSTPGSPSLNKLAPLPMKQSQSSTQPKFSTVEPNFHLSSISKFPSCSDLFPQRTFDDLLSRPYQENYNIPSTKNNEKLHLESNGNLAQMDISQVDSERLSLIYEKYRFSFWNVIAMEYGVGVHPLLLESSWKQRSQHNCPPTPSLSPKASFFSGGTQNDGNIHPVKHHQNLVPENRASVNISDLLGIDANPRNPQEREIIKLLEERRELITL